MTRLATDTWSTTRRCLVLTLDIVNCLALLHLAIVFKVSTRAQIEIQSLGLLVETIGWLIFNIFHLAVGTLLTIRPSTLATLSTVQIVNELVQITNH